ncbi:MAG: DHH family phosphoesterase [Candidatus Micrarchaeota archaeon]
MDYLKEGADFLASVRKNSKAFIISHDDSDGVCSAVMINRFLESRGVKTSYAVSYSNVSETVLGKIEENNPEFLVFVDLNVDQYPEMISRVTKSRKTLIVDHHKMQNDLSGMAGVTFVKAEKVDSQMEPVRYAASKMCFDILGRLGGFENLDYLAAVGMAGDLALDAWPEFRDSADKKYGLKQVRLVSSKIYSFKSVGEIEKAFQIVNDCDSFEELSSSEELEEMLEKVEKKINKVNADFEKKKEVFEDKKLIIYKMKESEIDVSSQVITGKSVSEYPDYLLVLIVEGKNKLTIKFRSNSRKPDAAKLVGLLKKSIPGLKGGGHAVAAGAFMYENIGAEKAKQKILENIDKCK